MTTRFAWLGGLGLLALGCPNDSPTADNTTDPDSSSSAEESGESSGPPTTTLTTTTLDESSSDSSESSTGPDAACGNDMIEGAEPCDGTDLGGQDCVTQGFDGGTLSCAADCSGFDTAACTVATCGNDAVEGKEACDGVDLGGATCESEGFSGGTLACAKNCMDFDTSACAFCGNGDIDEGEVCDDSLGGQSCVGQGFDSGSLACAVDCMSFDTSGCGTCGNDVIDGSEFCDGTNLAGNDCFSLGLGFDSGTLSCAANCTGFDSSTCGTCGNGVVDGDEFCDGGDLDGQTCETQGYDSGALGCAADCSAFVFDECATCGDGVRDVSETCDGDDLNGETCESLGLTGGTLACSGSCEYDVAACEVPGMLFGSDSGYNGYSLMPGELPCDDISATGTGTLLTDDSNIEVAMGFTFPVYGTDFDNVTIQSNGVLSWNGNVYLSYGNQCLPTATAPSNNNLYVFWDDLNPGTGAGEVWYQTLGDPGDQRFVVQWDTAHFGGDALDFIRVQAVLYEATGQIIVCYPDTISAMNVGNSGAEATSGIQLDSMTGFDFSCNTADLVDGLQLLYIPL